jgi:hypothetical protein
MKEKRDLQRIGGTDDFSDENLDSMIDETE